MSTDTSQRPDTAARNASDDATGPAGEKPSRALVVAGAASVAAGLVHYLAAAMHLPDESVAALLFTLVGVAQIVWPALLRLAGRWVLLAGIVLNAVAVIAWLLSRTVGAPIGHHAGEVEAVGIVDSLCVATELVVVVAAAIALRNRGRLRSAGAAE